MTMKSMLETLTRLQADFAVARQAEIETRHAVWQQQQAIERAAIAAAGYTVGEQIELADGTPAWISHMQLSHDASKLMATCYRTLKSGQRSKAPDRTVVLKTLEDMS